MNAAISSMTVRKVRLKRFHHYGKGNDIDFFPKCINVSQIKRSNDENDSNESKARAALS